MWQDDLQDQLILKIYLKKKKKECAGGSPCNPSYSGGRDQEDHGSKPAWANGS
jgi:hypothetical protein